MLAWMILFVQLTLKIRRSSIAQKCAADSDLHGALPVAFVEDAHGVHSRLWVYGDVLPKKKALLRMRSSTQGDYVQKLVQTPKKRIRPKKTNRC